MGPRCELTHREDVEALNTRDPCVYWQKADTASLRQVPLVLAPLLQLGTSLLLHGSRMQIWGSFL